MSERQSAENDAAPHLAWCTPCDEPHPSCIVTKGLSALYTCPTTGETESRTLGGFDVCCDHPRCPGNRVIPPAMGGAS